jgi:hypothetical protein
MMARKTLLPIAPFPPSFFPMRRLILLLNTKRHLHSDIVVNRPKSSCIRQGKRGLLVEIRVLVDYLIGIEIGWPVLEGWLF